MIDNILYFKYKIRVYSANKYCIMIKRAAIVTVVVQQPLRETA